MPPEKTLLSSQTRHGEADARIAITSPDELRQWLAAHHQQTESVWLVTWKKGDPRYVTYSDIVDEVLCFGWVDSLPRKLDHIRSMLRISPRRAASAWSKVNKDRVERLIRDGRMAPAGLAKVNSAKASGLWSKLDGVDALAVPSDLAAALTAHAPAETNWNAFPRSARRGILEWIEQARKPETRARRVHETATRAAKGERANQWR